MFKKITAFAVAMTIAVVSLAFPVSAADEIKPKVSKTAVFDYGQFLGNENQRGVYDSKTPRNKEEFEIKWTKKTGDGWNDVPGSPIIVGDYVYSYSSQYLRKYDLLTGNEVKKAKVFSVSSSQFFINLGYGDGKIFVPLNKNNMEPESTVKKSYLRVFDAETLEQLYITEDTFVGDMQTPVMYHDGYVVTGGYRGDGYYACFTTKDDDPSTPNEIKKPIWKVKTTNPNGFTFNGAAFVKDYVYFAENGRGKESNIWAVNYKTGEIADNFTLPTKYDSKSTLVYNDKNNRLYVPANTPERKATILSYEVMPDGKLNRTTVKQWTSSFANGGVKSSPVIYNDRLYITGTGFGEPFHVIDANTMTDIYTIDEVVTGGSAAVSTAYATKDNGNQVYIYIVPFDASKFYIIKDKEGQTAPEIESFPVGTNYCSQTVAIAKNGYLVWYQDDKTLYVCGRKDSETASKYTADDVKAQIERMDDPAGFGYYNKAEIERLNARYSELTETEKAKVTNYDKLKKINEVMLFDGANAVERIKNGIDALPAEITLENKNTVQILMTEYSKLSDEDKAAITNVAKLNSANATITALLEKEEAKKINKAIKELPELTKITTADKGTVNSLTARYNALSDSAKALVTEKKKLTDCKEKIDFYEEKISLAKELINENVANKDITLNSKADIKEIDEVLALLPEADKALITEIEQYLSPAKVELVNLMIEEIKDTKVTSKNVESLKATIKEIEDLYFGILSDDLKYVNGYDKVELLKREVEGFVISPNTSENSNIFAIIMLSMILSAAAAFTFKSKKENI